MKQFRERNYIRYLIFSVVIIIIGTVLGYHQLAPTRAPKDANEQIITLSEVTSDKADYSMMMSHVYHMSKEAHPSGSDAIKRVQSYLTEQFEAIGCSYQTQSFEQDLTKIIEDKLIDYEEYMKDYPEEREPFEQYLKSLGFASYEEKLRKDYNCTTNTKLPLTNYIVKLDAPNSEEGVLFVSHYDSTSGGPGAADDLVSVAAMLEALREASKHEVQKNDLYFLFTDGEEMDLFGAEHYVNTGSSEKDYIKLVINLEARGNSGPLIMFETSLRNKNLIKELNKSLDHNLMFSFAAAIYRLMPNDTDLTCFLKRGYPGVNFAAIGSPENYHAATDTFDNLNRDSAYMYYKTTSILSEYFSNSDLTDLSSSEDAVYFPFLRGNTLVLSNQLMLILSYILAGISLIWIGFLLFKRVVRLKNFLVAVALLLLTFVPAVLLGSLCSFLYNRIIMGRALLQVMSMLNVLFYTFCGLSIIVTLALIWCMIRRRKSQTVLAGILLLYTLINIACTQFLNGLAYVFMIPLGMLLLYSIIQYINRNKMRQPLPRYLYVIVFGIILCVLYIPVMDLIYTALLKDSILVVFPLASLGILPIAALSKITTYKIDEKDVKQ